MPLQVLTAEALVLWPFAGEALQPLLAFPLRVAYGEAQQAPANPFRPPTERVPV